MTFIEKPLSLLYFKPKLKHIENFKNNPIEVQDKVLKYLIKQAESVEWGRRYNYDKINSSKDFIEAVPIQSYESMEPYFIRMMKGEQNIIWNKEISSFSKSSGTTTGHSKFIPVSKETLFGCHYEAGKALVGTYINNCEDSKLLTRKNISVIGSFDQSNRNIITGDVSAILAKYLPSWADFIKTPKKEIGLIPDWNEKINKIANIVVKEDVASLLGVPSWMSVILRKVVETAGKDISELWPNLEVYFHGGVAFEPYEEMYKQLITNPNMNYVNVYNASEGFFAFQDRLNAEDLLLLLDYNIYYEFVPIDSNDEHYAIGLDEVEIGKNYAMIISNNSGLWRYRIGDTVSFTSKYPFRIKITGRTKSFINVVGEEVIVNNADKAINKACIETAAVLEEYTVAPIFYDDNAVAHEWYIEFIDEPKDINLFTKILDKTLKEVNTDYASKRSNDLVLRPPVVKLLPRNTFYRWFQQNNKLGGQHKVIRLFEKRDIVNELDEIIQKNK